MRRTTTLWFLLYLAILTAGLLVSNPFAIAGGEETCLREVYFTYFDPMAHFVLFAGLGILAYGSRWPGRMSVRLALLVVYAAGTEGLQYFVPPRTPELKDLLENLGGIALGTVLGWLLLGRREPAAATAENNAPIRPS